jgi:predicted XRE-type DNA-binding protein
MGREIINKKINIFGISFLYFIVISLFAANSYGFLTDEIAASVDNTPITLNELYFLYNFNAINNLKYRNLNKIISNVKLKPTLNFYINRMLILKQEEKVGGLKVSESRVNALTSDFEKKFKMIHKKTGFNSFLTKFGLNKTDFNVFVKNILIEKIFIDERLRFFLFTLENSGKITQNVKQKYNKELSLKLKNMLSGIKKHSEIEINDNFN